MAVNFSVPHNRGSEYTILPEDIIVKPDLNGRHDLPNIDWLITSMLSQGQLQPVLIRSENKAPVLVAGFSRWRAAVEINKRGLTSVPFKLRCTYFNGNEFDAFKANIAENRERNANTPMDDAYNIQRLINWNQTIEQVADIYHEKPTWVKSRLKLIKLEPEAQTAVAEGRLKPTAAVHIAELSAAQQRKAVAGEGAVKVEPKKPGLKSIKEIIQTTADDTTQPHAVRKFCEGLLKQMEGK